MGEWIRLKAADGFEFDAWKAVPTGKAKGGVVVVQEIFGVNAHIRAVTDAFAGAGYLAVAPAIYDRVEPKLECGYTPEDIAKARDWRAGCNLDNVMLDIDAAAKEASAGGKVGIVGYCWGGSLSFVAACRLPSISAASGYYGGQIVPHLDETVVAPTMLHFGALDKGIPLTDVETIRSRKPDVQVFVYEGAGHGFNCDHRADYNAACAATALERTMAHFAKHLG
ncbi:MAG: dienelactone hydrolase family protein [Pseudomonadota bacterium]|nr:dienelactone hydrolase family protein [Pseudomonadota bacterium]